MQKTQKLKILICEADARILSRLESWIQTIGESVESTTDGIEALSLSQEIQPDIILVSQNIKNIGGLELIEKIKVIFPNQAIIFMMNDDTSAIKKAIDLQVDKYLNTPVTPKPLFYAIDSLAQEKVWHDEFKHHKRLLENYKDAIDLSFSVSRHDKEGNILDVNDLFCITSKLRYKEAMQGVVNPLNNPNEDMNLVWDALHTDLLYKDRQIFVLPDNSQRIIDITAVGLVNDKEEVYEYLVFSDDVTEIVQTKRKIKNQELESRLEKLNHAKELNRVKDSFLTIFTHELRTPLNSIINFSEYVHKHLKKEKFSKRDRLLGQVDEIHSSGLFMLDMINNLMEAMKLRSSKITLQITPLNVKSILESIVNSYSAKLQPKVMHLACSETLEIMSDHQRLVQILTNLISNAVKYSRSKIEINVIEMGDKFVICIEDDGAGFTTTQNIFDIFEQADTNSMTREASGIGVGLYIVKQLCDKMHFTIKIATSKHLGGAKVFIEGKKEQVL